MTHKSLWIESVWNEMKWWLCCLGTKARVTIDLIIQETEVIVKTLIHLYTDPHTRLGLKMADQTELFMEFNTGQFTYWSDLQCVCR